MPRTQPPARPSFLAGGGEMGGLIADFDWSSTSLGPIDGWPAVTKTTVALTLQSPVPIVTMWGAPGSMIYNDAYEELVGRSVSGKTLREALPEVTDQGFIELLDNVVQSGEPFIGRAVPVRIGLDADAQEKFVDFVYQPMIGEDGERIGIFVQGYDVTDHKRTEALRILHNRVLALALEDRPLGETLESLVHVVEEYSTSGVLASILLLDDDGKHLRHGAAPSLPDAYNAAI